MQIITSEFFLFVVVVFLRLGVSRGAAGWVGTCPSTGAVGSNRRCETLYLVFREQQTSQAFCELALQSG